MDWMYAILNGLLFVGTGVAVVAWIVFSFWVGVKVDDRLDSGHSTLIALITMMIGLLFAVGFLTALEV